MIYISKCNDKKTKEIRARLEGKNVYRWMKLKGEFECDDNDDAINSIVRELEKRIEAEKKNGDETAFSLNER